MDRRAFLRASALVAAGVIAADQLEILDRLAPRSLFAGWDKPVIRNVRTGLPSVTWRKLNAGIKPSHDEAVRQMIAILQESNTLLADMAFRDGAVNIVKSSPFVSWRNLPPLGVLS